MNVVIVQIWTVDVEGERRSCVRTHWGGWRIVPVVPMSIGLVRRTVRPGDVARSSQRANGRKTLLAGLLPEGVDSKVRAATGGAGLELWRGRNTGSFARRIMPPEFSAAALEPARPVPCGAPSRRGSAVADRPSAAPGHALAAHTAAR